MQFFHYTAPEKLKAIGIHGLTVGDVPTDIQNNKGRCGVWLTNSDQATGHGLESSTIDKRRYRLTIDISPEDLHIHHWPSWASDNVTLYTFNALKQSGGDAFEAWWIYFGCIPTSAIVACFDTFHSEYVEDWSAITGPGGRTLPGVPPWRRSAWHKSLLKQIARELARTS